MPDSGWSKSPSHSCGLKSVAFLHRAGGGSWCGGCGREALPPLRPASPQQDTELLATPAYGLISSCQYFLILKLRNCFSLWACFLQTLLTLRHRYYFDSNYFACISKQTDSHAGLEYDTPHIDWGSVMGSTFPNTWQTIKNKFATNCVFSFVLSSWHWTGTHCPQTEGHTSFPLLQFVTPFMWGFRFSRLCLWRLPSSRMWRRVVWYDFTNISGQHAAEELETARSYETSVNFDPTTRRYIPQQDRDLQKHESPCCREVIITRVQFAFHNLFYSDNILWRFRSTF
jgi:hypothetical protein